MYFRGLYNDLGLLRLNSSVHLTSELRPACLQTIEDEAGMEGQKNATVAGWGVTHRKDGSQGEIDHDSTISHWGRRNDEGKGPGGRNYCLVISSYHMLWSSLAGLAS